ncbi:tRNA (adenine(58)-N(1))-methyltransferase, mitochondrial isoform X2 [Petaurus breviceps papuanus]|uniref:tRNA (adenine(58)-N(1))-methyltransferase, mitochondrial isoform X2 n=1 Tax=Petaurus breviceps papuanus TaxID=3040969 RepID=UPI0036DB90CE
MLLPAGRCRSLLVRLPQRSGFGLGHCLHGRLPSCVPVRLRRRPTCLLGGTGPRSCASFPRDPGDLGEGSRTWGKDEEPLDVSVVPQQGDNTAWSQPSLGAQAARSSLEKPTPVLPEETLLPEIEYVVPGHEECSAESQATSPPPPRTSGPGCEAQPPSIDKLPAHAVRPSPKELPFQPGDLLYAEFQKGENIFKRLFKLEATGQLSSNWGAIPYKEMIGKFPGQLLRSSIGYHFLLRRPALEEFVLFMKRGPTISYPKVALDMLNPQIALPIVYPNLKQGGICAVYLANITQVIELLEGIRICKLALSCEQIREVLLRDWLVCPAKRKDGTLAQRVEPKTGMDLKLHPQRDFETEESENVKEKDYGESLSGFPYSSIPYIARPFHCQASHTAFLVKLRKFNPEH